MVASAVFITDLQGKAIISRNYRGDVPLTKSIERFAKYLVEVEDEAKKPVFHVDNNSDIQAGENVGATGTGGEHFVYVSVSTTFTYLLGMQFAPPKTWSLLTLLCVAAPIDTNTRCFNLSFDYFHCSIKMYTFVP
jgi:hypothetical protein